MYFSTFFLFLHNIRIIKVMMNACVHKYGNKQWAMGEGLKRKKTVIMFYAVINIQTIEIIARYAST